MALYRCGGSSGANIKTYTLSTTGNGGNERSVTIDFSNTIPNYSQYTLNENMYGVWNGRFYTTSATQYVTPTMTWDASTGSLKLTDGGSASYLTRVSRNITHTVTLICID